jgi:hypothetical protein
MIKRVLVVLVLAVVTVGGVFAQGKGANSSRFSLGAGVTGGMVFPGFQVAAEIDIGKTGGNVIAIEAGTTDIVMLQSFVSIRNYVLDQDLAYISYGATFGLSTMLIGATFGGGIRLPITSNKKLCIDANGKLAVGLLGFPKAFSSTSIVYRF